MTKLYSRFRVMTLTFAIGLASVGFSNYVANSIGWNDEESFAPEQVVFVSIAGFDKSRHRFAISGRGFGDDGSAAFYESDSGELLTESRFSGDRRDLKKILRNAKVIERDEKAENVLGEIGLRIVAKDVEKNGKRFFVIAWTDSNYIRLINAPTLELATELEMFLRVEYFDDRVRN